MQAAPEKGGGLMLFVGIDPGITGAMAIQDQDRRILHVENLAQFAGRMRATNGHALADRLVSLAGSDQVGMVAVERVHSMPGQGVSSTFSFGVNFGIVLGVVQSLKLPYCLPTPQSWQGLIFGKGSPAKHAAAKDRRRIVKQRTREWVIAEYRKSYSEAKSDAIAMSEYARRYVLQGER